MDVAAQAVAVITAAFHGDADTAADLAVEAAAEALTPALIGAVAGLAVRLVRDTAEVLGVDPAAVIERLALEVAAHPREAEPLRTSTALTITLAPRTAASDTARTGARCSHWWPPAH